MDEEIIEPGDETAEVAAPANRTTMVLLGVIAVLLVAIVIVLVNGRGADQPTVNNNAGTAGTPSMGGMPTASNVPFDPASATQVPAGETPQAHVEAYFSAIVAEDYAAAYDRLPADKKAAQDVASYGNQLSGYGINDFSIDNVKEDGESSEVLASAIAPGGSFQYLWTFVKDGDTWLVKSRTMPGMGQ